MGEEMTLTEISGTVEKITYLNSANSYTVATVTTKDENITVVGILPFLNEGDTAVFTGDYTFHPTYGQQFKAVEFKRIIPKNQADILKYLSSGAIKGIGPATARRIVEKFGERSLEVIENNPEELSNLRGISIEKAKNIGAEYAKQFGIREIMLMLSKYGVGADRCINIYRRFGQKSTEIIKSNPYTLCERGIDFPFETAEELALEFGFEKDSELRVCAGIEYVLNRNLSNGHTCLPRDKFVDVCSNLLECNQSTVEVCCDRLIDCFRIASKTIGKTEFLALPEYFSAEQYIAARLLSIKENIDNTVKVHELEIENVENHLNIKFENLQKQAIFEAFENGILILTGGPGTGKTTTLNAIIKLFESRDLKIELAAPTGRASKRMTELCGREAKTIHRLLEVEWGENDKRSFARNEKNPLDCDVIIVDEASMIDALLFADLLKALKRSTRIIIVGDSDQLPSIGAGNILGDILAADIFPAIRLKKVFRQALKSKIVTNAHAIINDETPDFSDKDSDCFFLHREDKYSAVNTVLELVSERLPSAYGIDPLTQIQILCPTKLMDTGTVNLNNLMQEKLNPRKGNEPQLSFKGFYLRVGDKVMQIKNNYDLQYKKDNGEYGSGIFNGDVGFVTDIDIRGGIIKVRYDDKVATYFSEDMSQLELAYAVTVHKSQGSEYDYVIIPLLDVPYKLKYRNLLYTAVTRAKKMLILVGDESVWTVMAKNDRKTLRYTLLTEFIKEKSAYAFY